MSNKVYEVWVGGVVVHSHQISSYTAADQLAKLYREDGYDDVHIEVLEVSFA